MLQRRRTTRARLLTAVGLALYAFVLVTLPFEHHDIVCHLKTPQHCTSCASSQLGSDPHALSAPGAARLADAGSAIAVEPTFEGAVLTTRSTGRSPPASL
jgi:hypothetical protein